MTTPDDAWRAARSQVESRIVQMAAENISPDFAAIGQRLTREAMSAGSSPRDLVSVLVRIAEALVAAPGQSRSISALLPKQRDGNGDLTFAEKREVRLSAISIMTVLCGAAVALAETLERRGIDPETKRRPFGFH